MVEDSGCAAIRVMLEVFARGKEEVKMIVIPVGGVSSS